MITDTNRLARAREFISRNEDLRQTCIELAMSDWFAEQFATFAEREVKAAVEAEWILVSERLPEKEDGYLVSHFFGSEEMVSESYWNMTQNRFEDPSENYKSMPDVIAWRPMPQPYHPKEKQ